MIYPGDLQFKSRRKLKNVAIIAVYIALTLGIGGIAALAEDPNSLSPLFQTMPADQFREYPNWEKIKTPDSPYSRTKGVFEAINREGRVSGTVIHLVSQGYGGPIQLLVGFDSLGRIVKVNVFRHQETECHITGMTKGKFLDQFLGVTIWDKLRLLVGLGPSTRGDIQAMAGGTVTSRAVTEAVAEARKVYYELFDGNVNDSDL